jgi:acyl-coenzyme A synthetase/AMP-(fatty) acid ligase
MEYLTLDYLLQCPLEPAITFYQNESEKIEWSYQQLVDYSLQILGLLEDNSIQNEFIGVACGHSVEIIAVLLG